MLPLPGGRSVLSLRTLPWGLLSLRPPPQQGRASPQHPPATLPDPKTRSASTPGSRRRDNGDITLLGTVYGVWHAERGVSQGQRGSGVEVPEPPPHRSHGAAGGRCCIFRLLLQHGAGGGGWAGGARSQLGARRQRNGHKSPGFDPKVDGVRAVGSPSAPVQQGQPMGTAASLRGGEQRCATLQGDLVPPVSPAATTGAAGLVEEGGHRGRPRASGGTQGDTSPQFLPLLRGSPRRAEPRGALSLPGGRWKRDGETEPGGSSCWD